MSLLSVLETLLIGPLKLVFEIIFVVANRVLGDNPGLAIVVLSLVMNIMVLPLYRRADAMQEAARDKEEQLREGVKHIKKTFSGDERMMILQTYYRQNDYRPTDILNGSVSLLLEVPFFMAAYQFLSNLTLLNYVPFGPIADLGVPDGMLTVGGIAVNVLPVLMTLINVISSAIYLKGFPLKTKIQLYGMAAFFLVFLYNSPSGLVFYWTLNNLFSLGKNLVVKVKPVQKIGKWLLLVVGVAAMVLGACYPLSTSRRVFALGVGMALIIPVVLNKLKKSRDVGIKTKAKYQPFGKLFTLGGLFLTVLTGMMIPSAYIAASAQEFVDPSYYHDPLLYIVMATSMAAGFFLVWFRVFYWLANDKIKVWFERGIWILCGVMLVNYMFFGRHLGVLLPNLQFEALFLRFTKAEKLLNPIVLILLMGGMLAFVIKWKHHAVSCLLVAVIALGSMSAWNMVTIRKDTAEIAQLAQKVDEVGAPEFSMSKDGKNVVVIMLDRAMGQLVPYILQEKPELQDTFDGFTYYQNTISHATATAFGAPGLLGGYEYTPESMNLRTQENLVDKHNEALRVMPVLFSENDFEVTVINPVLANYQWIPDVSIYEEYPGVDAYISEGVYLDNDWKQLQIDINYRNFFCFSIMKTMPVVLQNAIYTGSTYNRATVSSDLTSTQIQHDTALAEGQHPLFMDAYLALDALEEMTTVAYTNDDTFLFMSNDITHEPMLLQAPEYLPALQVDNREYDALHADRFERDGESVNIDDSYKMSHYHANMAALLRLGEWFDYLRENDVYDNTRIILVSDHSIALDLIGDMVLENAEGITFDVGAYHALLMVKDFNSHGFRISDEFMTNADVPTLAMTELIADPVNPFTGNRINMDAKQNNRQYIYTSRDWYVTEHSGDMFSANYWIRAGEDIFDPTGWDVSEEKSQLPVETAFVHN